jgi:hypothetical protein
LQHLKKCPTGFKVQKENADATLLATRKQDIALRGRCVTASEFGPKRQAGQSASFGGHASTALESTFKKYLSNPIELFPTYSLLSKRTDEDLPH